MHVENPFDRLLQDRPLNGLPRVLVVSAHPDDEVVGLGGQMVFIPGAFFLCVTDGAPRDMRDALSAGFQTREEYARARREELLGALAMAGIGPHQVRSAGRVDQEASLELSGLAWFLAELLAEMRPDLVLTLPYEGGHPDHEAVAFAVHAGAALMEKAGRPRPALVEYTSYFARNGGMAVAEFLDGEQGMTIDLSPAARARKEAMIACFRSQERILRAFPMDVERFRRAPAYDFTVSPHPGRLFYENFSWGMDGLRWRALAGNAVAELGLTGRI